MLLDSLLNWSDPSASFHEATAKIDPRQRPRSDDPTLRPPDEAPPRLAPEDRVDLSVSLPEGEEDTAFLPRPGEIRDVRHMSPRDLADFAHELYIEGVLKWDEYRAIGFPTELNPQYDKTIGALTGEKAQPDQPRDMIAEWENRLDFSRAHAGPDSASAERAQRILNVLKWHEIPKVSLEA